MPDSLHTLAPRCREREPSTSSALGHSRRHRHVRSLVRSPQYRTLPHRSRFGTANSRYGGRGEYVMTAHLIRGDRDGQITSDNRKCVKSLRSKYSYSVFQKNMVLSAHPILTQRGASRSSRTLRAGCGGRQDGQRACRVDEIILADGEVV